MQEGRNFFIIQLLAPGDTTVEPLAPTKLRCQHIAITPGTQPVAWPRHPNSNIHILQDPSGGNTMQRLNAGLRHALHRGAYAALCLLPGVRITPDSILRLATRMHRDNELGAVGPSVMVRHRRGGRRFHGGGWIDLDSGRFGLPEQAGYAMDFLMPDAMMVRSMSLRRVGLFDVRLGESWSVADWCLRMAEAGWGAQVDDEAYAIRRTISRADVMHDGAGYIDVLSRHSHRHKAVLQRAGRRHALWLLNQNQPLSALRFYQQSRTRRVWHGTHVIDRLHQQHRRAA